MIDPVDIHARLDQEPFKAFRIRMSDGNSYDVTNPDWAVPMDTQMFLALNRRRWKFLSYQSMAGIESGDDTAA